VKRSAGIAVLALVACFGVPGAEATPPPGFNGLIAFTSARVTAMGNVPNIWTRAPDGTEMNLTNSPSNDNEDPAWSPDGSRIAFARSEGGLFHIWLMDADGENQVRLTSGFYERNPAWSPDGATIAFTSDRPNLGTAPHIWLMNADGTNLRQLTDDSTTHHVLSQSPDWSPDGTHIVFDDAFDIYVMNADGSNVTQLTTDPAHDWNPTFSPDGQSIAFVSERPGDENADVYVMSQNGSNQRSLTTTYANEIDPAWSPDGTQIAYVSDESIGAGEFVLWTMNVDGSGAKAVIENTADRDGGPAWQRRSTVFPPPPPPPQPPPSDCFVPNVVGLKFAAARARIAKRDCRVGRIVRRSSTRRQKGRVLAQRPKPRKLLPNRTKINLTLGAGKHR
jgi:Tol biopolymer transport system component